MPKAKTDDNTKADAYAYADIALSSGHVSTRGTPMYIAEPFETVHCRTFSDGINAHTIELS